MPSTRQPKTPFQGRNLKADSLLTVTEAATYIGCSARTVRQLVLDGYLEARRMNFKPKSPWLIRWDSIEVYLKRLATN